jgi:hypothetical protein
MNTVKEAADEKRKWPSSGKYSRVREVVVRA